MIQRLVAFLLCLALPSVSQAISVDDHPYLRAMVDRLVSEHGLDEGELTRIFSKATLRPEVVEAITSPAERLPWSRYRSFFVNPVQIESGVRFWKNHEKELLRAERETGVSSKIIVAVIGIETRYGTTLGSHLVLDSLTTLTLRYPRRRKFFGAQLEQFLLLTHEQSLNRLAIRGSYAGAIGIPQFMPSSYRQYAVDFSGDGKTDLINQTEDAIGSVANYLRRFKWQAGRPVSVRIASNPNLDAGLPGSKPRLHTTVGELRAAGIKVAADVPDDLKAGVVGLDGKNRTLYWIVFENFHVLMRYNPSVQYVMAVHELSTALKREYRGSY
ncbi:MAG: Membrane-bound lytic murein transglycosylase B [Gammaproteobacteria bacterium]|nr:Membrane-bound lytic murein transglycosylase B [Gammaproteobacteria bacterium]